MTDGAEGAAMKREVDYPVEEAETGDTTTDLEGEQADAHEAKAPETESEPLAESDAAEESDGDEDAEEADAEESDAEATLDAQAEDGAHPQAEADGAAQAEPGDHRRMVEALLFAAAEPLDVKSISRRLPDGADVKAILAELTEFYEGRGIELTCVADKWAFRTASDLAFLMSEERIEPKKLSRAALETLAIVAYHQPVTRAEIEDIRGVSVSKGTLDFLLEIGWVRLRGRRRAPGRPVLYGTTEAFLEHFGLETVGDLPGMEELKASGLLEARLPQGFSVPSPSGEPDEDEVPLEDGDDGAEFQQDFLSEDEAAADAEAAEAGDPPDAA